MTHEESGLNQTLCGNIGRLWGDCRICGRFGALIISDRIQKYRTVVFVGYSINLLSVFALIPDFNVKLKTVIYELA